LRVPIGGSVAIPEGDRALAEPVASIPIGVADERGGDAARVDATCLLHQRRSDGGQRFSPDRRDG